MPSSILVGMLRYGEAEFHLSLDALKRQKGVKFDFFVLEGLPNKEAHDRLYQTFMDSASQHEHFLKLDADMVFRGVGALAAMRERICHKPGTAHLMMDVMDWPSQLSIPGIQMFRSDVRWVGSSDKLNVDYPPLIAGDSVIVTDDCVVDHMPDPSHFQSFRYGLHKALKSLQPDRREKNVAKGLIHAAILAGIARHWRATKDVRLGLALSAAALVFDGGAKHLLHDYAGANSKELFDEIASGDFQNHLLPTVEEFWANEIQSYMRWLYCMNNTVWP